MISLTHFDVLILDIPECDSDPCQNGAVCTDGVNGYGCSCQAGWYGTNCELGRLNV